MTERRGRSSQDSPSDHDSPIEGYLDRLLVALAAHPPREIRQLLTETEAHLRDAAEEAVRGGMSGDDAEIDAVRRFGPPTDLASAERLRRTMPLVTLARQGLASAWFVGALAALAVGVSGLLAALLGAVGGARFLADAPGRVLTASDCARWLAADPRALSCHQAAVGDWAAETVFYRLAVGVLGVAALGAFAVARRRLVPPGCRPALPATVVDTVAATLFGAAGLWLVGMSVDAVLASSGHGAGQWLSAAPVALAAAAVFGLRLVRDLRSPPDAGAATLVPA